MPETSVEAKSASALNKLRNRRKTLRASATRDVNSAKNTLEEITPENSLEAEVMQAKLRRHHAQLTDIDQQILEIGDFTEDEIAAECDRQQTYSEALSDQIELLEVKLRRVHITASAQDQQQGSPSGSGKPDKVKIPKLELTKFDGDPLHWEEFWDDFTCSVDSRSDLSIIDKFKLLKQSLKDEALNVADGYFLTQRNYQEVKDALLERFGDPQVAIFAHFTALLELKPASHEVDQLSQIRDKCEAHIRSLSALGLPEDTFGLVFAPIILSKLPRFVKMEIHRRNGSQRWTLAALREHLKEEIRVRTKSDRAFHASHDVISTSEETKASKTAKRSGGTASSLLVQGGKGKGKKKVPNTPASKPNSRVPNCVFCQGSHQPWDCSEYPTVDVRLPRVHGRCFACLSDKHMKKDYRSSKKCYYCKVSGHHSSLCYQQFGKSEKSKEPSNMDQSVLVQALNPSASEFVPKDSVHAVQSSNSASLLQNGGGKAVLESAIVKVSGPKGCCRARVIFDNGSTASFVRGIVAKKIGATVNGEFHTEMSKFGDSPRESRKYSSRKISIHLRDGSELIVSLRQVPSISAPMQLVPIPLDTISSCLDKKDHSNIVIESETAEIDILLGLDYYYDIVGPKIQRFPNGLVVKDTAVGKIVTGYLRETSMNSDQDQSMLIVTLSETEQDLFDLERFWRVEDAGAVEKTERPDDEVAVELFNKSVRLVDGRYEVKWPFKEDPPNLPINYDIALRRLVSVHRKLLNSPDLLATYHQIFLDQPEKGVIEEAPVVAQGPVHFLPHHAVVIPSRETTKVRLVFDASSKPSTHFQSLNESMYRGPVFLNDLCGLLLRFRHYAFAVTSDVEKAFLQISLNVSHRDCTRFIWLRDPSKSVSPDNMVVYRYPRVLFGATASPFLLAATIMHHMSLANTDVSRQIMESTYMDNIVNGASTTVELLEYFHEAKGLISGMNMNLHQWYSNNREFLDAIPAPERGARTRPSVLGLKWDIQADTLACSVGKDISTDRVTKRSVLKRTASVYDPCGWFSPVTVTGKILMQQLWAESRSWDETVASEIAKSWHSISQSLDELKVQTIPRGHPWSIGDSVQDLQLHTFCDAFKKAYSAVVYVRVKFLQGVSCDMVFGKSRVDPLEGLTIPKLELEAIRLGKRLTVFVESRLRVPVSSKTLWTDSDCALCWIENAKVKTTFVRNRVREIRSVPALNFRFVPSELNPADIGSRGATTAELMKSNLWWKGPEFLRDPNAVWPERSQKESVLVQGTSESSHVTFVDGSVQPDQLFDLHRFSSLSKLLRVTAYVKRACGRFRGRRFPQGNLSAAKIQKSRIFWEKRIHLQHFVPLFDSSSRNAKFQSFARQLGLFRDDSGFIRCRGWFQSSSSLDEAAKAPVLLPRSSRFTELVIQDCHSQVMHYGVKHTLAKLRERYWVTTGRKIVKSVISKCLVCRKYGGGPFQVPDAPPLPEFRASIKQPFSFVGLDYFGPLRVRDEPADKKLIISDNARQFKAADRLLRKELQEIVSSGNVADFLATSGISWKFIVERAPWMGGFYERLVGIVKEGLKKSIGKWTLTSNELATICYEVSFIVNSRPLLYADDDPSDCVLTPVDVLFRSKRCFPDMSGEDVFQDHVSKTDELLKHWRTGQNLLRCFWDEWKSSYLSSLREVSMQAKQRGTSGIPISVGAVVLIKDSNLPRGQWMTGRVVTLHRSADRAIRSASVRLTSGSILSRPIKLLYPLEAGIGNGLSDSHGTSDSANPQMQVDNAQAQTATFARPQRKAAQTA